jgi:hypothetical protein
VQQAFDDLKSIVSSSDSRNFDSTTLHDVRRAARDIERQLAARQKSSNMRRLEPLFDSLDHYSKAIEIVCNGTPYLPWIWAPMKLILQVSFGIMLSGVLEWAFRIMMHLLPNPIRQSGAQKIIPSDPLSHPLPRVRQLKLPGLFRIHRRISNSYRCIRANSRQSATIQQFERVSEGKHRFPRDFSRILRRYSSFPRRGIPVDSQKR